MLEGYGKCDVYINGKGFSDVNPVDCGWERCRPGHYFGPAVREYYLIHYITSGSGTFKNERGEYTLGPGQLFIIRPGEITYYKASVTDPWYYSWIGFTGKCGALFDGAPDVMSADCREYFDAMRDSMEYDSMREEIIVGQIFLMLSKLFGKKGSGRLNTTGFAARAANYIEHHYMQAVSVERLADEMNIDRRYLSRLFKREYGVTMQEFIVSSRMRHAESFLKDGYSVGQTAAMSGYSDVFNFSKMFKKYYGYSPSSVLRSLRKM